MKLPASRSLLHGTVARGAYGERAAYALPLRREVVVAVGQGEAALPHQGEVPRLAGEHVEVAGEPRPGLEPADGVGRARR